MTVHPNDRDWDHLDALVDVDPIALRDAAWRLAVALDQAEAERDQARAQVDRVRALLVGHGVADSDVLLEQIDGALGW